MKTAKIKKVIRMSAFVLGGFLGIFLSCLISFMASVIALIATLLGSSALLRWILPGMVTPASFSALLGLLLLVGSMVLYMLFCVKSEGGLYRISQSNFYRGSRSASVPRVIERLRLAWSTACGFAVPVLFTVALILPKWVGVAPKARASAAKIAVMTAAKECAVKKAEGEISPSFASVQLDQYLIEPKSQDCNGDENGEIRATPNNKAEYPEFTYSIKSGQRKCSHLGSKEELYGCSGRINGSW